MEDVRIYVHIPFCKSKCQYCDFNSYDNKNYLIDSYINCVLDEIDIQYSTIKNRNITSIFLGGGTPSYLKPHLIRSILHHLPFDRNTEVTIEVNPGTIDRDKLESYLDMGINRISFGVQSLNDQLLRLMGRVHTRETALSNIKMAKEVGFTNISADLMMGYPLQSFEIYEETLHTMIELDMQHLSCYSLKVEENTPLDRMIKRKMLPEPKDELDRKMYHFTERILKENDILQYEISNYARKGFECKHNMGYWELDEYLGFGISAHSYFKGKRFHNTESITDYIHDIKEKRLTRFDEEVIDANESRKEFIILGLRLNKGLNIEKFNEKYDSDFMNDYKTAIEKCLKDQVISIKNNVVVLTKLGKDFANSVFTEFM
ncbi:MAG: radical SAM family heme chaperone HemW [Clostridia bacterium]|nr:radical SAM family heme chaperone HemW [Clostridia bacterium]